MYCQICFEKSRSFFQTSIGTVNQSFLSTRCFPWHFETCWSNTNFLKKVISYRKITVLFPLYQFLVNFLKNTYIHVYTLSKQNRLHSLTESLDFKKFNSTNHVLVSILNLLKKYLNNYFFVHGVFIDLLKGFDIVNHNNFLAKLDHYGIHVQANNWLQFFLTVHK